jgi:hypothetical protein
MDRSLTIFIERVILRCEGDESSLSRDSLATVFALAMLETEERLEKEHKEHAEQLKRRETT